MKPFIRSRLWITEHHSNSIFGLFLVPKILIFHPVLGWWCQYNWHKELKNMGCSLVSQLTGWRCICTNSKSTIAIKSFPFGLCGSREVVFSELAFMAVWFWPSRWSPWARARGAENLCCVFKHLECAFPSPDSAAKGLSTLICKLSGHRCSAVLKTIGYSDTSGV